MHLKMYTKSNNKMEMCAHKMPNAQCPNPINGFICTSPSSDYQKCVQCSIIINRDPRYCVKIIQINRVNILPDILLYVRLHFLYFRHFPKLDYYCIIGGNGTYSHQAIYHSFERFNFNLKSDLDHCIFINMLIQYTWNPKSFCMVSDHTYTAAHQLYCHFFSYLKKEKKVPANLQLNANWLRRAFVNDNNERKKLYVQNHRWIFLLFRVGNGYWTSSVFGSIDEIATSTIFCWSRFSNEWTNGVNVLCFMQQRHHSRFICIFSFWMWLFPIK